MRKILHADCDCFYAAVEMRDDPSLAQRPIAVGGQAAQRGVIATCNYPARSFGIHSAMSTAQAMRLCPNLRVIPPNFEKYRRVSQDIQTIFHELTPLVEPLSLDEAFLDVSSVTSFKGSATWMASWLKEEVKKRTGITISVGVASNKFLAKIASDWNKPDGLCVISPDQVESFLDSLEVKHLHGVGPATAKRLHEMGIQTCQQLRQWSVAALIERFGKFGYRLHELSNGIDNREIQIERERKSVSVETTFHHDLPNLISCREALPHLVAQLKVRLSKRNHPTPNKLFVKVRFTDFSSTTLESGGNSPDVENFLALLDEAWQRGARPVRLLGVGVRLSPAEATQQLSLFT
ncbi:DNA polymerase IV [Phytohalomonas tamaricis]|uniref:DNA polymerase IV n=1 Tax=Phytohalomonas tamaricis TaxID=2081032 RepID=UPI000D0B1953|nr:DNA polymerase IV [Phytohalomonas tamaricis]